MIWLPVYLIWVRSFINGLMFRYVDSYPAALHLVPIIGLPCAIAALYAKFHTLWKPTR